ncbi:Outer membrane usher protein PapC [Klebsiella pasteurii]|nr:Outer membrane usher protein PapC [Klebsiella pasteurii]
MISFYDFNKEKHMISANNKSIYLAILLVSDFSYAVDFNVDMINGAKDKTDLNKFSDSSYVVPGKYLFDLYVNKKRTKQFDIYYYEDNKNNTLYCIPINAFNYLSIKNTILDSPPIENVTIGNVLKQCLDSDALAKVGVTIIPNVTQSIVSFIVPEIIQEKQYDNWTPPLLWDDGVAAGILDYNFYTYYNKSQSGLSNNSGLIFGKTGVNFGAWRYRANYELETYNKNKKTTVRDINAFRPITSLKALLSVGEISITSYVFSTFRMLGANIRDDQRMLPPQLRGYSPTVSGVAKSNATVTISYLGRVIYKTTVPPGPFSIKDLDSGLQGKIDVTIAEQNGQEQHFVQYLESVPYLSRKGHIRYNFSAGRTLRNDHKTDDIEIIMGDLSYGISDNTSIFGGSILSKKYRAFNIGLAQGLGVLGALSADVTSSSADLENGSRSSGNSYRFNYSKDFISTNSTLTFSNYRYSEKGYLDIQEYLDIYHMNKNGKNGHFYNENYFYGKSKSLYVINFSQQFFSDYPELAFNANLSYSRQNYWNNKTTNRRVSILLGKRWSMFNKNIYSSLSFSNNKYNNINDNNLSLNMSVDLGDSDSISYSTTEYGNQLSHNVSLYQNFKNNDSMMTTLTSDPSRRGFISNYQHSFPVSDITLNGSIDTQNTKSLSAQLKGGVTATREGVVVHPWINSDSRVVVNTNGIKNVGFTNSNNTSNSQGLLVLNGNTYYGQDIQVDFNRIPKDVEFFETNKSVTPTEGAVSYVYFDSLRGEKGLVVIRLSDGSFPPFAADVYNGNEKRVGIVGQNGLTYIAGLVKGESFNVFWENKKMCQFTVNELNLSNGRTTFTCVQF